MKKKILFLLLIVFIFPMSIFADTIYNVDMDIELLEDGSGVITEVWDVKADSGSEWYKQLYNLGESEVSNFVVYMDGNKLTEKSWDVNESLNEKAGYYGINYVNDGIELCFGKSDMKKHTFTLKYNISKMVFNTSDYQVLYWTLLPKSTMSGFTVDITSYYEFPDTLDVWGYGYKGYAYVSDGKISMSNEGSLYNNYVTLLVKFPLNTFNTSYSVDKFATFSDVLNKAEEGTYDYDYGTDSENDSKSSISLDALYILIFDLIIFIIIILIFRIGNEISPLEYSLGYINNKKIDEKNVAMYRDIPCNKDVFYANALLKMNNYKYNETNLFGAIILKWIKENKITYKIEKIKNKNVKMLDLTKNVTFDNPLEEKLFNIMVLASKDGMLETMEFEKWCKKHYDKFMSIFEEMSDDIVEKLISNKEIYRRKNKEECKNNNVMSDKIYDDSVKLYGLKLYLKEFANMNTKEVMEVKLWDEYLMFAYLFGIADKVAKQLKNMYPDEFVITKEFDFSTIKFVDDFSRHCSSVAINTRKKVLERTKKINKTVSNLSSITDGYSGGGGGNSSGGGGKGSFGGGGSMGGR